MKITSEELTYCAPFALERPSISFQNVLLLQFV